MNSPQPHDVHFLSAGQDKAEEFVCVMSPVAQGSEFEVVGPTDQAPPQQYPFQNTPCAGPTANTVLDKGNNSMSNLQVCHTSKYDYPPPPDSPPPPLPLSPPPLLPPLSLSLYPDFPPPTFEESLLVAGTITKMGEALGEGGPFCCTIMAYHQAHIHMNAIKQALICPWLCHHKSNNGAAKNRLVQLLNC